MKTGAATSISPVELPTRRDGPYVSVFVRSDPLRVDIERALAQATNADFDTTTGDLATMIEQTPEDNANAIVILELNEVGDEELDRLGAFKRSPAGQNRSLIVTGSDLSHLNMIKLLRAGVEEFLTQPIDPEELSVAISRVYGERTRFAQGGSSGGKIISFVHAAGGAGATTLAVNSALCLSAEKPREKPTTCIVDLDLQFGGVQIQLDLRSHSKIEDMIDSPDRLDREMLDAMLLTHESNIRVLTAPDLPIPLEAIDARTVERVLTLLKRRYDYVVVDLPQTLTSWTDTVLRMSHVVFLVTQLSVPTVWQARRMLDLLDREGLSTLPIKVVVNRYNSARRVNDSIGLSQVESALGRKIDYFIPNDFDLISDSLNQGRPALDLKRRSRFVESLQDMLGEAVEGRAMEPRGRLSLFQNLKSMFGG